MVTRWRNWEFLSLIDSSGLLIVSFWFIYYEFSWVFICDSTITRSINLLTWWNCIRGWNSWLSRLICRHLIIYLASLSRISIVRRRTNNSSILLPKIWDWPRLWRMKISKLIWRSKIPLLSRPHWMENLGVLRMIYLSSLSRRKLDRILNIRLNAIWRYWHYVSVDLLTGWT